MDESWDASELKRAYSEQVVGSQATDIWLASAMVYEQAREWGSDGNSQEMIYEGRQAHNRDPRRRHDQNNQ
jgi:hypothetical protein